LDSVLAQKRPPAPLEAGQLKSRLCIACRFFPDAFPNIFSPWLFFACCTRHRDRMLLETICPRSFAVKNVIFYPRCNTGVLKDEKKTLRD
ncbi:MAG: hypothetical protein J5600_00265, partial [Desulfovibrio sp.]|nr:hypothetical protein [Desulfovibrio sp.]